MNVLSNPFSISDRTTPTHTISIYDCDFESAACPSWTIVGQPELSWTRVQASTVLQDDAHNPPFDHTANQADGYYLLLKPNQALPFFDVRKTKQMNFSFLKISRRFLLEKRHQSISKFNYV